MFLIFYFFLLSKIFQIISALGACDFAPIFSDITPDYCYTDRNGTFLFYEETNCIPKCNVNSTDQLNPCDDIYDQVNDPKTNLAMYPTCQTDNYFAPRQCKGQPTTGRCFCSDPYGIRLDGQQWWNKADKMTCACSRKKYDMRKANIYHYISLHCDDEGNYEPLQCDIINKMCWCVEPTTGNLESMVVPITARSFLPCYNPVQYGAEYLRQCESQDYAQSKIQYEFKTHGTLDIHFSTFNCDEDGAYGSFKITNGIALCTWKDNSIIESYQSDATTNITGLDCNCARDGIIYEKSGKERIQSCDGNGNYKTYQLINNQQYCVDSDGYSYSKKTPKDPDECQQLFPMPLS